MIEIVIAPSHLAGAKVIRSHPDGLGEPAGFWLALDRLAPPRDPRAGNIARGNLVTHSLDSRTVHMDEADLAAFRAELGDAPENADVERALLLIGRRAMPVVGVTTPGAA